MIDPRTQQIATLKGEIAQLETAISALANIPAAQASLQVQLAEKRHQLAALLGQPSQGMPGIVQYQSGGINFGAGNNIGTIGDVIAGDKVAGDKIAGDRISVGDVSNSSGIAIGRGAAAHVSSAPMSAPATALFERIYRQIERLPEDQVIKADLAEQVRRIEQEAGQGDMADAAVIERQLKLLARLSPEIFTAIATALTNPLAGMVVAVRTAAQRIQALHPGS